MDQDVWSPSIETNKEEGIRSTQLTDNDALFDRVIRK